MKKIFVIFLLVCGSAGGYAQIIYKMQLRYFNRAALDSYPQEVVSFRQVDSICHVTIRNSAVKADTSLLKIVKQAVVDPSLPYPSDVLPFLEPTTLIDYRLPELQVIADTLFGNEKNVWSIISKGLKFASTYIETFDDSLAVEIDKGNSITEDIATILRRRKGTCSEHTNLFIALMRSRSIPCRFITGYVYCPPQIVGGAHAWAECYVNGAGWIPVDPQVGRLSYPIGIKLFTGKDYPDCGIKVLSDIEPLSIEIKNNAYLQRKK